MIALTSPLPRKNGVHLTAVVSALLLSAGTSFAAIQTQVGYHSEGQESLGFTFTNVPAPSKNDAATGAKFDVVFGKADGSGGDIDKLNDGKLPTESDEPGENFFFAVGTDGGRIQVDLNRAVEIKQINTYSWHPGGRAPQVYKVYGSEGTAADFVAKPGKDADLAKSGWKLVAQVDTRSAGSEIGGQYGVSISDSNGVIGKYRYLLFDVARGEDSPFGNTFYSEIDVVELNAPVAAVPAVVSTPPFVVKSADGYCTISIDTSKAPELKQWAEQKLAPALSEWYPKLVAMMPSEGYSAPKKFSIAIRPGDGVAATGGTRISVNSTWLAKAVDTEGVGALVHEVVHVIQQYNWGHRAGAGNPPPNWLTEGIPDYLRFFVYEPQSHGADMVYFQNYFKRRPMTDLNYDKLYRISANFLNYTVEKYGADKNLILKMNAACRQGTYSDEMWKELTGKSLTDLNDEWKAAVQAQLPKKTESGTNSVAAVKK